MALRIVVVVDLVTRSILERQAAALESIADTLLAIEKDLSKPSASALNLGFGPTEPKSP